MDKQSQNYTLSILIPARNEMFLKKTIEDILEHSEANTEIIAVLDGAWADPAIPQHERVNVIYVPESIGQRAATNIAARLARGKYVMKLDAHVSFDQGFDRKMLEAFKISGDNVTMVPVMRNLWAFDWVCPDGHKRYQSPSGPCRDCAKPTVREITWKIRGDEGTTARRQWKSRHSPANASFCFDAEPHFQYFSDYRRRPEYEKDKTETGLTETMSLQGSCFMATREKYWELNLSDELVGSWGNQGIEVACKTWLSGGRVLVNHATWYAHLFRTQGGDFAFPYKQSERQIRKTKQMVWDHFFNGKWDKQVHPMSWLIEKFWPVPGWTEETLHKLKQ